MDQRDYICTLVLTIQQEFNYLLGQFYAKISKDAELMSFRKKDESNRMNEKDHIRDEYE